MAFGHLSHDGEKLIVYTEHKELGYGKGKSGNWWALIAFDVIADEKKDLSKDYEGIEGYLSKWTFPASCELAVRRILEARDRQFRLLSQEECNKQLKKLRKMPPKD